MAARKTKFLTDEHRQKIKVSMIINRLNSFVEGEVKMEGPQVTAALGLLKKVLPDMQATQLSNDPDNPLMPVISNKPLTKQEWNERYSSDMGSTGGATESTD